MNYLYPLTPSITPTQLFSSAEWFIQLILNPNTFLIKTSSGCKHLSHPGDWTKAVHGTHPRGGALVQSPASVQSLSSEGHKFSGPLTVVPPALILKHTLCAFKKRKQVLFLYGSLRLKTWNVPPCVDLFTCLFACLDGWVF